MSARQQDRLGKERIGSTNRVVRGDGALRRDCVRLRRALDGQKGDSDFLLLNGRLFSVVPLACDMKSVCCHYTPSRGGLRTISWTETNSLSPVMGTDCTRNLSRHL